MQEKEREIKEHIGILYEYFFVKMTGWKNYKFRPSDNQEKQISNFVKLLHKNYHLLSIGPNFLIDYYTFQFKYWSELDTRFEGKVMLNWVVGKKALDRWDNKQSSWNYFLQEFIKRFNIDKDILVAKLNGVKIVNKIPLQDIEKLRFYNTERGFVNCIEVTTLYNHRSKLCIFCKFKKDCKKLKLG